ncbi:LytR/AlgR family response regulator transcription factor [Nesterenkonia alba]|uniref:LytR/AlgR family response regulator transcription factor n=1 Tax=Nesterenkonia alba TaxID=515814 RepID=UPI000422AB97|nr:LytTR family DNA-binding domain-containing protein [Nesterenkonia alba]
MVSTALIVDDEAPAREELRYLLQEATDGPAAQVRVVGEAAHAEEALLLMDSVDYDLVFCDIRMPGLSGLELAARVSASGHGPQVIFTTAYPDHAVEAFDVAAADYLVKPIDAGRLNLAVQRALAAAAVTPQSVPAAASSHAPASEAGLNRVPVQNGGRTVLVEGEAIVYAAAARGYSSLKLAEEKVLVSYSLNELERRLTGRFFRAHRSCLVNLEYVRELVSTGAGGLTLVMGDRQRSRVEVSRRQARELRRRLGV